MSTALQERPAAAEAFPPPPRPARRRGPLLAAGAAALALLVAVPLAGRLDLLPSIGNPVEQVTVDRTGPALELALRDLAELHAAQGTYSVTVDLERDTRWVPSVISGERTTYVAVGRVDGIVDLTGLRAGAVEVSDDGRSARISLPPPRLGPPALDLERSRVVARDRGALDRVGGVFSDSPTSEREVAAVAERRIAEAAAQSDLLRRTRWSAQRTLHDLARSLGVEDVTVVYDAADGV